MKKWRGVNKMEKFAKKGKNIFKRDIREEKIEYRDQGKWEKLQKKNL
jgi:hypothetical protein